MELLFVMVFNSCRKEILWGVRLGFVGEEFWILEMWIGWLVSVESIRCWVKCLWFVKCRNLGLELDMVMIDLKRFGDFCVELNECLLGCKIIGDKKYNFVILVWFWFGLKRYVGVDFNFEFCVGDLLISFF